MIIEQNATFFENNFDFVYAVCPVSIMWVKNVCRCRNCEQ